MPNGNFNRQGTESYQKLMGSLEARDGTRDIYHDYFRVIRYRYRKSSQRHIGKHNRSKWFFPIHIVLFSRSANDVNGKDIYGETTDGGAHALKGLITMCARYILAGEK
jgi:hypothetical protein